MAVINVSKPVSGNVIYNVAPGSEVMLDFGLTEASVSTEGNSLIISFDNGSTVALDGAVGTEGIAIVMPDGTKLALDQFVQSIGEEEPAAGGEAGGSGSNYNTDFGNLLGGLNGLDPLGNEFTGGAIPDRELGTDALAEEGVTEAAPIPEPEPELEPEAEPEPEPEPPPFTFSFTSEHMVYEAGLPGGSAEGSRSNEVRGSFTISNAQGEAYMQVDGHEVDLARLAQGYEQVFETNNGSLVLNGYDPATGAVSFVYTLKQNIQHAEPGDPDNLDVIAPGDSFTITAGDAAGNVISRPLSISVVDDAPVANDDFIAIKQSTLADFGTWDDSRSLLANDIRSADGQSITSLDFDAEASPGIRAITYNKEEQVWKVETEYGVLHVDNQGRYTFEPNDGFTNLNGSVQVNFTYTLTDGDGDQSSANVILDLYNQTGLNPNLAPQIITSEYAVNDIVTATGNTQGTYGMYSKVTALPDGNYVVAWQNGGTIYTQLYNPLGQTIGNPVTVTTAAYTNQTFDHSDSFTISTTPNGGYLVTWDNTNHTAGYGQLYNSDGSRQGNAMNMAANDYYNANSVSSYNWSASTEYTQARDTIILSKGGYIVLGHDNDGNYYNVNMAILNSSGQLAQTTINAGSTIDPVITMHTQSGHTFNGSVVEIAPDRIAVVYIHSPGSGSTLGTGSSSGTALEGSNYTDKQGSAGSVLHVSIFDITRDVNGNIINTSIVGKELTIDTGTNKFPEVTALEDGRFAVVWQSEEMGKGLVKVQVLESDGSPAVGFEQVQYVSSGSGHQLVPTVTSLPGGGFVVVWTEKNADTGYDIIARRYDADGKPTGEPIEITRGVEGYSHGGDYDTQRHPDVTVLADGRIVITWTTLSGKNSGIAEVHHQILHPDVFGEAAPLPQYVSGQEDLYPLGAAILGMYDPDADAPGAARVQIANPKGGDILSLDADWCAEHGISVQVLSGGTLLVITVTDPNLSVAEQWQVITDAIKQVSYSNILPESQVASGERTLTVIVSDSKGASSSVDVQFQVVAKNEPPDLLFTGNEHLDAEMNVAVSIIALGTVKITDAEADNIATARITITNYVKGADFLSLDLPQDDPRFAGITASFDQETGVLTIIGTASAAVYQQVLGYVYYQCESKVPLTDDRIISVSVSDEMGLHPYSNPAVITVTTQHPTAPLITSGGDPYAHTAYSYGSGSQPITVALHDGGYALCVKVVGGIELSTFNANGTERGVNLVISGVDSVKSLTQLADGSIVALGQQGGQSVLVHIGGDGQPQSWPSPFATITDIVALPHGGCMVAGINEAGKAVWVEVSAYGVPSTVCIIGEASATHPNVEMAVLADGKLVFVYEAQNGATQVVSYDGSQFSQPYTLPYEAVNNSGQVSICALDNGKFVVIWCSGENLASAPFASEVLAAQVFNADGSPSGGRFYVDTVAYTKHGDLQTIPLAGGTFAVVWSSINDHTGKEVFVLIMDVNGVPLLHSAMQHGSAEVQPSISALASGGWVIAWQESASGVVKYQVFNGDGSVRDSSFYVASNSSVSVFHDVYIADPNNDLISQAKVSIDGFKPGDVLFFKGFDPAAYGMAVHYDAVTGVLTISGDASAQDYQNALNALNFQNYSTGSIEGVRDIHVTLWDNSGAEQNQSNTMSSSIEVHDNLHVVSGSGDLYGSIGNDIIIGGDGDDVIYGGLGDDILSGGSGADTFVYNWSANEGHDLILDYKIEEDDVIMLQDLVDDGVGNYNIEIAVMNNGGKLQLEFDGGTTLTFANINHADAVAVGVGNFVQFVDDDGNNVTSQILFNISL